jgi:hypothetical protein
MIHDCILITAAREEEEERGRPEGKLTGNPPGRSAWPEEGRR